MYKIKLVFGNSKEGFPDYSKFERDILRLYPIEKNLEGKWYRFMFVTIDFIDDLPKYFFERVVKKNRLFEIFRLFALAGAALLGAEIFLYAMQLSWAVEVLMYVWFALLLAFSACAIRHYKDVKDAYCLKRIMDYSASYFRYENFRGKKNAAVPARSLWGEKIKQARQDASFEWSSSTLTVIEHLSAHGPKEMSYDDIGLVAGISRPSARELILKLVKNGVVIDDGGKYRFAGVEFEICLIGKNSKAIELTDYQRKRLDLLFSILCFQGF